MTQTRNHWIPLLSVALAILLAGATAISFSQPTQTCIYVAPNNQLPVSLSAGEACVKPSEGAAVLTDCTIGTCDWVLLNTNQGMGGTVFYIATTINHRRHFLTATSPGQPCILQDHSGTNQEWIFTPKNGRYEIQLRSPNSYEFTSVFLSVSNHNKVTTTFQPSVNRRSLWCIRTCH